MSSVYKMPERVVVRVDLFKETGKWGYRFLVDIPYRAHGGYISDAKKLLEEIDANQEEVVKGTVISGEYFVVIDCSANDTAPQTFIVEGNSAGRQATRDPRYEGEFFLSRLYSPEAVKRIMRGFPVPRFKRSKLSDWEDWPNASIPLPPRVVDAPFQECHHQPEHGKCVQWHGVHFYAIAFEFNGRESRTWTCEDGWLPRTCDDRR